MPPVPVHHLEIRHSRLSSPITVDLPWDQFPVRAQGELDRIDADDSGTLVYSPETTPGQLQEVTDANRSAVTFRRLFWAYQDNPYDDQGQNDSTTATRQATARQIQDRVYQDVVLPIVTDPENESQWLEAGRVLETLSDSRHLLEMAHTAWGYWQARNDDKFLRIAERLLLEAKRIEAAYPERTTDLYSRIETSLSVVDSELERIDRAALEQQRQEPYLLPSTEAPVTVNLRPGQSDYEITMRVAVPTDWSDERVAEYFRDNPLTARPSTFQGYQPTDEDVSLGFVRVVTEEQAETRVEHYTSFIYPRNVNQVLFGGTRQYRQVVFSVCRCDDLLGTRDIRKFDLHFDGPEANDRILPGSFVIQELEGETIRILFASDIHINERDYETARVMIESLRAGPDETIDPALVEQYLDRIERFYGYFNENVEVMVEEFNECYRNGECHRVVITGDLVDFINVAATLDDQGYRGTNVRRLFHILSKLEAPLSMKPGNHDAHIAPYARSEHEQGFPDDSAMGDLYASHYDRHQFETSNPIELKIRSLESLLTRRCTVDEYGHTDCIVQMMRDLFAEDPFAASTEEGMAPYFQLLGTNEADLTYMGNNFFIFQWKTNEEHFNQQRWVFEELHEPVGLNLFRGAGTYFNDQHVNGKGPRPETALYFLRSVAAVRGVGGNMVVAEHYPPFYQGTSAADQTPDAADALRGEPNWLLRLAAYYFRHEDGSPVIDTVVSGHVHKWGEYDFSFRDFAEEEDFRRDLGQVFERAISGEMTGEELYEAVHEELWHRYHLGAHIITRRVIGTGPTDPGPIVSEFNRDSLAYGQERGTLFVNIPAVGPASSTSPAGYMAMDIEPNGRTRITPYFYFREPDGTLLRGTGQELPELRRQHAERVVQWQRSVGMTVTDPTIPTGVPQMTVSGPRAVEDWTVDWLPLLCQYPRGKICFAVGIEPLWNMSGQEFGFAVTPFQMTIPLSDRHSPVWGVNYLRLGVDYSTITDWDFRVNLGLGLVEPYVQSGFRFGQGDRQYYGGGVLLGGASAMVVPAIDLNATFSEDLSNYNVQLGLRWYWDWISIQPSGHSH